MSFTGTFPSQVISPSFQRAWLPFKDIQFEKASIFLMGHHCKVDIAHGVPIALILPPDEKSSEVELITIGAYSITRRFNVGS